MKYTAAILLFTLLVACETPEPTVIVEDHVGLWRISEVRLDGVLKSGWKGLEVTITQTSDTGGEILIPGSLDSKILWRQATWEKAQPNQLAINAQDPMYQEDLSYAVSGDKMEFYRNVAGDMTPCCPEGGFVLPIVPTWAFILERVSE
jgi:hypothetical protein